MKSTTNVKTKQTQNCLILYFLFRTCMSAMIHYDMSKRICCTFYIWYHHHYPALITCTQVVLHCHSYTYIVMNMVILLYMYMQSSQSTCMYTLLLAILHIWHHFLKGISDLIVLAGFIWDTISVDVLIHSTRVSSITVSPSTTVDEHLWGQVNLRKRVFLHNPNPVTECRCGTHCPAGAKIGRASCRERV